jgi:tetratricopeptide (TPR) repeat protein
MTTRNAKLERALNLHRQGRLREAAAEYQEVLAVEPQHADALHLLGGALLELGMYAEAIPCFDRAAAVQPALAAAFLGRGTAFLHLGLLEPALANLGHAVRLAPNDPKTHNGLGVALERVDRRPEALHCFEQALALDPHQADAHHNRGVLLAAQGRHAEALASIERALVLQPRQAAAQANRGTALLALGREAEALSSFDRAIALEPAAATAHHNRGLALMTLERPAEALASFDQALELGLDGASTHLWRAKALLALGQLAAALPSLDRAIVIGPADFDTHLQRGIALARLERHAESVAAFGQALALDRDSAEAFNNRGAVLVRLFRPAEAIDDFVRAIECRPDYADAYINAGITQKGLGRPLEALRSLDRALALKPDEPTATWSKSVLKLALGAYRDGWPLYEARFRLPHVASNQRHFDGPRWSGGASIAGRTVFVHAEQGLGDTLQFCRYIPLLEGLGATVVFEVQPQLVPLMQSLDVRATIIGRGEPLPPFDFHTPLLSLPLAFGTDADSIPGGVPYLRVDPAATLEWRGRLATLPGFKVGLNWHGNPQAEKHAALQARSFPLSAAAALARLPAVTLVSLQKGEGAAQRTQVDFGEAIVQLTDPWHMGPDELAAETAAILLGLDLVITADTALAHLAGALGVPVWVVVQAVPDWRWLTDRTDSPWYPTLRLFRQRIAGEWPEVLGRVAAELAAKLSG